jgi:AMMECR1
MEAPIPPACGLPWRALDGALSDAKREAVARLVRRLLQWQRTLGRWPVLRGAPDATPFVSLYAEGTLRGCFGSEEGGGGERLARAFLRALADPRFGGARPEERDALVAQVSYLRGVTPLRSIDAALAAIEPGTHGVAVIRPDGIPAILLPSVARDRALSARGLLAALAHKAGLARDDLERGALFVFEADEIAARRGERTAGAVGSRVDLAADWLSRLVREDGFVHFGVDVRGRNVTKVGPMHHGRAAVVVRALAAHGGHARDVQRARAWLEREIRGALRGAGVEGWPAERERVAGTIALACLAGVPLGKELAAFVAGDDLGASPWHAGQVVTALGKGAPERVWRTCVAALEANPNGSAPWIATAAHARGEEGALDRAARGLEASIGRGRPHDGGARVTEVPELALTAVALEALAPLARPQARDAIARGRAFLARWQYVPGRVPAAIDPDLAQGAFPLSPIAPYARGDVTGHALLALLA